MRPLFAAALLAALSPLAHAAPHGIMWARGARVSAQSDKSGGNLLYYGGPVISNAKVYAVFWGDKIDAKIKDGIGPFFTNILDSGYMDWLKEYDTAGIRAVDGRPGTGQHIGRGRYLGAITITPANRSSDLTDEMIQKELQGQIDSGALPAADENTLYMVYFPKGVGISIADQRSCSTFCAYHEGFKSRSGAPVYYGVMPVCGGWGCGASFEDVTYVSSHECLEAVTDPFPTPGDNPAYPQAWNTSSGEEIADVCPAQSSVTGHGLSSRVSQLWDNASSACNPGPWTQNAAPTRTSPLAARWRPWWKVPAAGAW